VSETSATNYVLGTEKYELERLKLQHNLWRTNTMGSWLKAGIKPGAKVIDIGAGPGFATTDLADLVGPQGRVAALERSVNYLQNLESIKAELNLENVQIYSLDLVKDQIPIQDFDAAWCRWVCCFVSRPEIIVRKIAGALRPGGTAVFYEYADYESWRMLPPEPLVDDFVQRVIKSWRNNGGEPNIAPRLVQALQESGFEITTLNPKVWCVKPGDDFWTWITSYMRVNTRRSLELNEISADAVERFLAMIDRAERNKDRFMITPMVLEIIAQKK